jgi:hypothetical protein
MNKNLIVLIIIFSLVVIGCGYLVWLVFNQAPATYPTVPNTNSEAAPGTPASNLPPLPPEPTPTPLPSQEPSVSPTSTASSTL